MTQKTFEMRSKWTLQKTALFHSTGSGYTFALDFGPAPQLDHPQLLPEQMFIASLCGSLMAGLISGACHGSIEIKDLKCDAFGSYSVTADIHGFDQIIIVPILTVDSAKSIIKILALLQKVRKCSIVANSTACEIVIAPQINVAELLSK